ncbi:hypothetical protein [Stappia indica]|uniref:hypothetical protein n=1 Tax=Stappia indica TaxID=538381 RepID=UPI0011463883|nr:hypothetical protein [Stappia indica]
MSEDWTAYRQWHALLDALCRKYGYRDNVRLADALCAASGNRTPSALDTAVKNLRNWRQGVHIPQRRNFLLLGKILKVDAHAGLREHWNRLYHHARGKPGQSRRTAPTSAPISAPTSARVAPPGRPGGAQGCGCGNW